MQGERATAEVLGAWFPARLMMPRPTEGPADPGARRRGETPWTLLYGDEYDDGTVLDRPPVETDLVDVQRDDDAPIIRYLVGPSPRKLDTGRHILGGEAVLSIVSDSS